MTSGSSLAPFNARHLRAALLISLNTIVRHATRVPLPFDRRCRKRTVANVLSIGFDRDGVVRARLLESTESQQAWFEEHGYEVLARLISTLAPSWPGENDELPPVRLRSDGQGERAVSGGLGGKARISGK